MAEQLPLLTQYERIKAQHRNEILFFRLGDFYEMFFQDAIEASAILNLTLTKRQDAPMCGVPYHASRAYIARLLKAGRKVAVCEQIGSPSKGKGIIEREVVEVLSPGTAMDEDYLDSGSSTYLAALGVFERHGGDSAGLAWLDASTGEFHALSFPASDIDRLRRELYRISPRELLVRESTMAVVDYERAVADLGELVINRFPDWTFSQEQGVSVLTGHFRTSHMRGFGFELDDPALAAAGMVLSYLRDCLGRDLAHVTSLGKAADEAYLAIDEASQKNLELVRNLRDGGLSFSLLDVLDHTRTAMGFRELYRRILLPLRSVQRINERLDAVDCMYRDQRSLERVRRLLASCMDAERLASRLAMKRCGPRDLLAIRNTINAARELEQALPANAPSGLSVSAAASAELSAFADTVTKAIMDEPALAINDGGFIREGWNDELDSYRLLKADAHGVLDRYLDDERTKTGLSGLRVKYNRVLGYYLELSKNAAGNAPSHFIRRQSTSTTERFVTEALSELESRINGASERIVELEKALFESLRDTLVPDAPQLAILAAQLASLDCCTALASAATAHAYTRPVVDDSCVLEVKGGRHPVVEAHLGSGQFVPNDTRLDAEAESFALITGPNMAGKSTFLRQNALIVLMAQAGSFVPAEHARIGVADRLFCRVGAQDNLARGESTFLLEMHETAGILRNASLRSLVVMDEVGRGTGTQDGLAIAQAVSEYLLDALGCRCLFATHYHELTAIQHPKLIDLSMAVDEREGDVVFLRRVVPGPAAGSYGIHVAALAGIPEAVVQRAQAIRLALIGLESAQPSLHMVAATVDAKNHAARTAPAGSLFSPEDLVLDELRAMDVNSLTPLDALNRLARLKKSLGERTHS